MGEKRVLYNLAFPGMENGVRCHLLNTSSLKLVLWKIDKAVLL